MTGLTQLIDTVPSTRYPVYMRLNAGDVIPDPILRSARTKLSQVGVCSQNVAPGIVVEPAPIPRSIGLDSLPRPAPDCRAGRRSWRRPLGALLKLRPQTESPKRFVGTSANRRLTIRLLMPNYHGKHIGYEGAGHED